MRQSRTNSLATSSTWQQASELFAAHQQTIYKSTDRMFAVLMAIQWIAGIVAALWIAPRTWIGTTSQTHVHVWAAIFLGGAINLFPIILSVKNPGATSTRYVIAAAQMMMSALLIHLTGGRIETHFHVFGSLAFLAFYRDWRVLVPATIVVAADHFLRGVFWPQSVYGVLSASEWRWLEHAGWVLFEDTFLFIAIKRSVGEMWGSAQRTAELNDNEERYRAVVEQTAEGLVLSDVDSLRVIECNAAFAKILGYTVAEALTLTAYDFVVDERDSIDSRAASFRKGELPPTDERRFRHKDGRIVDVEVNVTVISYGGKDVFCAIVRDIGERKRAQEALRESELRFRSVTHSANDPIISADSKGNIVFWNKGAETAFGYTEEEILGQPLSLLISEEYRAAHLKGMERFMATGEARVIGKTVELKGLRKDGTMFPFDLSLATWRTAHGSFFTGIMRDITDRKQAEEALRRAHEELETRVRERTSELAAANQGLQREVAERKLVEDALRESEERYRLLFESNPLPMWVYDSETLSFLAVNEAACSHYGYSSEEFLAMTIMDIRPPDVVPALLDTLSKVSAGLYEAGVWKHRKRDGTIIDVGITSYALTFADRPAKLVLARDITERLRAEAEILFQKARFQQLFENAPMGILRVDQDDHVVDVNKEFEAIFQFSLNEIQGRPVNEIIVPEARLEEGTALSAKTLRGEIIEEETVRQRKGGNLIPVQVYGMPIVADQKPVGAFAIYIDLTARKQAQEEISQLAAIVESSDDAIIGKDLDGTITSWNQGAQRLYGYETGEVVGRSISMLIPPERSGELRSILELLGKDQGVSLYETERLTKDGRRLCVSLTISPIKDASGRIRGASTIARDITERRRMEAERQVMFEIIQGVIATPNLDELLKLIHHSIGKLVYAENCFVAIQDPTTDLMHFEFWVDKLDPCPPPLPIGIGFSSYVLRTGQPLLLNRELTEQMYRNGDVEKSGSASASWLGVPLRTHAHTIGVLVVQHYEDEHAYSDRDLEFLTSVGSQIALAIERKRTEQELRNSEEQLRQSQKMESIGTLAGGIAHDFNNLMTAVTGYSELTLRSLEAGHPLRPRIEEIRKAGERAASLTSQLLAFSRKQMLQPRVLDLNTVITGMGKMLPRMIGEDIDLHMTLDDSLGQVKADPGQIEQVLLNLAVNARDAMPEGGFLSIKTENVYFDVKFSQRRSVVEPGHYVTMTVSDSGCGMDAETRTHIFEPFFTTKEIGKGTGLGLSTVYGIVKQSGGSIWVYSEVGRGTTFRIYLPRVDEVVETEEAGDVCHSVPRGDETILLVEDEEMVRDLSKEILEEYGYEVITAPNGKEGLRICKEFQGRIDLVITDVVMPQMGGRELAQSVAALRPDTRVLYMSGFTDDAIVRHGVLDDGYLFIQKPFSPDSLALKVREVLDHAGGSTTDGSTLISLQSPMKHSETIRRN